MKKPFLSISLCASLLLSACGGEKNTPQGEVPVIDVETAIQNPQELLLTDLGETLTYIPLETTDESLVKLGSGSKMTVTKQYIFIGEELSVASVKGRANTEIRQKWKWMLKPNVFTLG